MKMLAIVLLVAMVPVSAGFAQFPLKTVGLNPPYLFESFESAWTGGTPPGWSKTNVVGSADWAQQVVPLTGQQPPTLNGVTGARHGIAAAWFATNVTPGTITRLESPAVDLTGETTARLRFFYFNKDGTDSLRVLVSTNFGATWDT